MIPHFNPNQLNEIEEILSSPKNIVITTHHKPDGDAIGSSLAMYNYLLKKKHKVKVVVPSEFPDFLNWMKGSDKIIDFMQKKKAAEKAFAGADIIFCLDFNEPSRVEGLKAAL